MSQGGVLSGNSGGGGSNVQTITPDVGAAIHPVANNINVQGENGTLPADSIVTHNFGDPDLGIENRRWLTAFIVDPSSTVGERGTYDTIQAAIDAANALGAGNVFIRPGVYSEDLTFAAYVNLFAFMDGTVSGVRLNMVTILGSHSGANATDVEIKNISFQDNGADPIFTIGDALNSPFIKFENCSFLSGPGRCIVVDQNSTVVVENCTMSANSYCMQGISNGIGIVRNSTLSGAIVAAIDVGGSSTWTLDNSFLGATTEGVNISSVTASGSSKNCTFSSAGSALNFTAAGSWQSISDVYSGATGIAGAAGSFSYADIVLTNGITIAAGITQTILNWQPYATTTTAGTASFNAANFSVSSGIVSLATIPACLVYVDTTINNVTGDGSTYKIIFDTKPFDQGSDFNLGTGTFVAPITGKYSVSYQVTIQGVTAFNNTGIASVTTSNRTYRNYPYVNVGALTICESCLNVLVDMDVGDTLFVNIATSDSGGKVDDVSGTSGGEVQTFLSVFLAN